MPLVKATLSDKSGGKVVFDFNPTLVTINRSYSPIPDNSLPKSADKPYRINNWNPSKLTLAEVKFVGADTRKNVNQLERWLEPARAASGGSGTSSVKAYHVPELKFDWGSTGRKKGLSEKVELESVMASFTRFTPEGMPVRANVTITLHVLGMDLKATNPTSGGLPGRHTVTLIQGQSLHSVALQSYGAPGHWRRVAQLNGIEDPLRVRPGSVVYLPNRDELYESDTT